MGWRLGGGVNGPAYYIHIGPRAGVRPKPGHGMQAVLARARIGPGRAVLGPGQNRRAWAGPMGFGLHGHL